MFTVDKATYKITLTRGDTLQVRFGAKFKVSGEAYEFQNGDELRFALKRNRMTADGGNFVDTRPLITKSIPTSTGLLQLAPGDTKDFRFGDYKYDIQLTYNGNLVATIIANADFELTPEVD